MSNPQYSIARPAGREHVLDYPPGSIAVRIVQLVLAFLIMVLSAYNIAALPYDGNAYILAVAVMTIVSSIYHLVAHFAAPVIYNYWAILGLDIFFVIMWLCSFALQAARVAYFYDYVRGYRLPDGDKAWLGTQAGAAALGAVEFVLFIVALVIHSIRLHRHRAAGGHCMPGQAPTPPGLAPVAAAAAPYGGEKTGPLPTYQPQYAPQPQQQQQQPVGNPVYQQQFPPQGQQQYSPQGPQQFTPQGQQQFSPQGQQQAYYPFPSPSPAPMYAPQPQQQLPSQLPSDNPPQRLPAQLPDNSPLPPQLPGN
ncbi:hypothetical protein C8A03DRAFT_35045 [Achaetomium macrosporum]|uniref:MARVEL domain-containing protein n=1 Tax=Achaetomium macrosporum TaxID=79813 RepID=A0AAN7HD60_9PEZI|nr:hypothetical protein C8A03DRAFT_35045 [Achaetomium macrosporum]